MNTPNYNNELDALLGELKQKKGIAAKTILEWIAHKKNVVYSPSTLSNYRAKGAEKKKKYDTLLDTVKEYAAHEIPPVVKKHKSKFAYFLNESFFIYYRTENDTSLNYEIHRAILNIGNSKNNIDILLPKDDADYQGFSTLLANSHLIFDLKTTETREKALRIIIPIPHSKTPEITIGQYSNLNSKGAIVSGCLVLELIKDKSKEHQPKTYKNTSSEYTKVPYLIRQFLKDSKKNRIKTTTGIFDYRELEKFLHIQKLKETDNKMKTGIFLSAPMGALDKEEYSSLWEEYIKLHSTILEVFPKPKYQICFLGKDAKAKEAFDNNILSMRKMLEKIKLLDKFILIYPKKVASSSLIELGVALALGKQCLVFVKTEEDLPYLLKNQHFKNLSVIVYDTTETILSLFKKLGMSIFDT
ncbi:hypothetical protein [Aureispira sp. CCB-QB1]|uniref:hypothetical protein n=1 Tax=Aureispira sp. CCB-QB1 TaxID=1313421 RepID=UPI000696D75D|nr:hypothetical protein [Aureispira sp. CCB-QB1]